MIPTLFHLLVLFSRIVAVQSFELSYRNGGRSFVSLAASQVPPEPPPRSFQATATKFWRFVRVPVPSALVDDDDWRPPPISVGTKEASKHKPEVLVVYLAVPALALLAQHFPSYQRGAGDPGGSEMFGDAATIVYTAAVVPLLLLAGSQGLPQWPAAAFAALLAGTASPNSPSTTNFSSLPVVFGALAVAALGALFEFEDRWDDSEDDNDDEGGSSIGPVSGRAALKAAPFEELDRLEAWDVQEQARRRGNSDSYHEEKNGSEKETTS